MPRRNGTGIALLADETRRRIIGMLAIKPRRPSVIASELRLSRPAISRQLRLLEQAGLVRSSRSWMDGRGLVYRIDPLAHGRITAWLAGTEVALPARTRAGHEGPEQPSAPAAQALRGSAVAHPRDRA